MSNKMNRFFVTYGNELYVNSRERLADEARKTGYFDKIIIYTPEMLPDYITNNSSFACVRGGGYWIWKPYVIKKTLESMEEGDVLLYCDAGMKLLESNKWNKYWDILLNYDIISFELGTFNIAWTRNYVFKHFNTRLPKFWKYCNQLQAGHIFIKKTAETLSIIKEWEMTMLTYPEAVIDVSPDCLALENKQFKEHRHDQSIWSALVYIYMNKCNTCILPDLSGYVLHFSDAFRSARISDLSIRTPGVTVCLFKEIIIVHIVKRVRRLYNVCLYFLGRLCI